MQLLKQAVEKTFKKAINVNELIPIINKIKEKASDLALKFIWYSPTRYCELNPVEY